MQISGKLDTHKLGRRYTANSSMDDAGIHIEIHERTNIEMNSDELTLSIGNISNTSHKNQNLPLASITRDSDSFIICVPKYSFLTLYLYHRENHYYFSSSLSAVKTFAKNTENNTAYMAFALKYQFFPEQQTIYKNISKIPPGHQLVITRDNIEFSPTTPKTPAPLDIDPHDNNKIQGYIHHSLLQAVDKLSDTHIPTGIMLGGFDSALLVSLLSELGRPIYAVTLSYDDRQYNQTHIEKLKKHFGFQHEWVKIEPGTIINGLNDYPLLFDQPVTQPHYLISSLKLGRSLADKGVETALTGDGCDGVFFGYPTVLKKARLLNIINKLPAFIKRKAYPLLASEIFERIAGQPARLLRQLLEVANRPENLQNFITAMAVDNYSLIKAIPGAHINPDLEHELLTSLYRANIKTGDWIDSAYISKNMVGLNRIKLASIWNHSGLKRIFSPYMMPDISALAAQIPKEFWLSESTPSGKYLLTQTALNHGLLDAKIIQQKKMSPVSSPVDGWMRNELKQEILKLLSSTGLINIAYCEKLLETHILEEFFKKHLTIDKYASQTLAMLLSYSSYYD